MFEVHECTDADACLALSRRFGADFAPGDRAFVFYEDGARGIGVLGLEKGTVVLKAVTDCGSEEYHEVLLRAVLAVARDFSPIRLIRRGVDRSLERFGFTEENGNMTVISNKIRLCCHG